MARDPRSLLQRVFGMEGRSSVVTLGPPRDPVIAEWLGQYARPPRA
jgi:hypothetical protein